MRKAKMTLGDIGFIAGIIGVLALILLPALFKYRESGGQRPCVNNLKELGLVLNMYSLENGDRFPPVDDRRNNFTFETRLLYPEYLSDASIAYCPFDVDYDPDTVFRLISDHPDGTPKGRVHPDCFTGDSYVYLGWAIARDEEAEALFEVYDELSWQDYDNEITVSEGMGNAGRNIIQRLETGAGESLITDISLIFSGEEIGSSVIPVVFDRPFADTMKRNHFVVPGCNVLYLDGHVDFHRYPGDFPVSITMAGSLDGRPREPIPHCEE
jgi:prepilin-type processing-associated H-X9-DG protein